jgi:hypothetical protein
VDTGIYPWNKTDDCLERVKNIKEQSRYEVWRKIYSYAESLAGTLISFAVFNSPAGFDKLIKSSIPTGF